MSDAELRKRNRATIEQFLSIPGTKADTQTALFTEDSIKEVPFITFFDTENGKYDPTFEKPLRFVGIAAVKKQFDLLLDRFPEWQWKNWKIWETDDPNYFWVEAFGEGIMMVNGERSVYKNQFINSFEMRDGKIRCFREFTNPLETLKSVGVSMEQLKLPDRHVTGQKR